MTKTQLFFIIAVVLLIAAYTIVYCLILKRKGRTKLKPAYVACAVLTIGLVFLFCKNIKLTKLEMEHNRVCPDNTMEIRNISVRDEDGNDTIPENRSVYGAYYGKESIPGYEKISETKGNVNYTWHISSNFAGLVEPNFILYLEYTGDDSDFDWQYITGTWLENGNVVDMIGDFETLKADVVMISGRYTENIDTIKIDIAASSALDGDSDKLEIQYQTKTTSER